MRLDGLRTYVQLASGLTEVARESAVASTRTLLTQGASRLGFVSAEELQAASMQARSLEERVQKLEAQMREQESAASAPPAKRAARPRKATAPTTTVTTGGRTASATKRSAAAGGEPSA